MVTGIRVVVVEAGSISLYQRTYHCFRQVRSSLTHPTPLRVLQLEVCHLNVKCIIKITSNLKTPCENVMKNQYKINYS